MSVKKRELIEFLQDATSKVSMLGKAIQTPIKKKVGDSDGN